MSLFRAGSTLPQRPYPFTGILPFLGPLLAGAAKFLAPVVLPAVATAVSTKVQQAVGGFLGVPTAAAAPQPVPEEPEEEEEIDLDALSDDEILSLLDELEGEGAAQPVSAPTPVQTLPAPTMVRTFPVATPTPIFKASQEWRDRPGRFAI